LALGQEAYRRYVASHSTPLFNNLNQAAVPVINFSTGTFPYLEDVAACGGNVIAVDFRVPLDAAWQKIGSERAIQGNHPAGALERAAVSPGPVAGRMVVLDSSSIWGTVYTKLHLRKTSGGWWIMCMRKQEERLASQTRRFADAVYLDLERLYSFVK
jgi:hypothetical protein